MIQFDKDNDQTVVLTEKELEEIFDLIEFTVYTQFESF